MIKETNQNVFPTDVNRRLIDGIHGLMIFNFYTKEFCIDLEYMDEIKRVDEVQIDINKNKEAFIHLEGQRYKLIELHKLMSYPELLTGSDNRIIFADIFNKKIAFMVEMINELLTTEFLLDEGSLDMEISTKKKYIKGIIKLQGRNIFIPDYEKISKDIRFL